MTTHADTGVWGKAAVLIARSIFAAPFIMAVSFKLDAQEARYYSGTFEWRERLDAHIGSGDNRAESSRTVNLSMVITAGHVQCHGSVNEMSQRWSAGRLEEDRLAHGDVAGAGLMSIEFSEGGIHSVGGEEVELADDEPSYNITIACPSPTMTVTGGGETETIPAGEARWGSSWEIQTYDWPGDFGHPSLRGNTTWDHPDSDPANGISGSVTVKWDLVKGPP